VVVLGTADLARSDDATYENLVQQGQRFLAQAQAAHVAGKRDEQYSFARKAEDKFLDAVRIKGNDARTFGLGCMAAAFRGDAGVAQQWFLKYRGLTPYGERDPEVHYLKAFVFVFATKHAGRAVDALNKMRALNPRYQPRRRDTLLYVARLGHGATLLRQEHYADAIKQYNEAARVAKAYGWERKELAALGSAGVALWVAKRSVEAVEHFEMLTKRDPENVLWHWQKGLAYASQHRYQEAIPVYEKVIALRKAGKDVPEHAQELDLVWLRLGNCLRNLATRMSDPEKQAKLRAEAKGHFETYIKMRPNDARGHRWIGMLYYPDQERPYEAIPHYKRAFELDRDCDVSLRYLHQIHMRHPAPPNATAEEAKAWAEQGEAYGKDIEEGQDLRAKRIAMREAASQLGESGCE
jgi:tetratricopeptide (TPR) repeat protein